jgi:hypothetical protein
MPRLLWRRIDKTNLDVLNGLPKGQYHITLAKPDGIEAFLEGLPREATELGGYTVQVPLEATRRPIPVAATSIEIAYIGPDSARADWRISSQHGDGAYLLWRGGNGARPGEGYVVIARDRDDRFHARWLRGADAPLELSGAVGVEPIDDWDAVAAALEIDGAGEVTGSVTSRPGAPYRPEDERVSTAQPDPFKIDPDIIDRGIAGHRRTQNAWAAHLVAQGLTPLSHRPLVDPPFDIAWFRGETLYVGEVKSLTGANEEKQLRLALGQVLRYAHQLGWIGRGGRPIVPVIIAEREPSDPTWFALCALLGVQLYWL